MFLTELCNLYSRLYNSGEPVPGVGMSLQEISFRIILRPSGEVVQIEDMREPYIATGTKKTELKKCTMSVLGECSRTSNVVPCFLWDNAAYLLGFTPKKKNCSKYFNKSKEKHLEIESEIDSPAYSAVCRFFERWDSSRCLEYIKDSELYAGRGVFMMEGSNHYVHEDSKIYEWWLTGGRKKWAGGQSEDTSENVGICLITGQNAPIATLHNSLEFIGRDLLKPKPKLVSFNQDSFESYGKKKCENSPVSEYAAFAYCSAFDYLMSRKTSSIRMGDANVIFWTDAAHKNEADEMEMIISGGLGNNKIEAIDSELVARVSLKLRDIAKGKRVLSDIDSSIRYFILGVSINVTRLAVRFFHTGTMGDFVSNLMEHYSALELKPRGGKFNDPDVILPYMILRETVRDLKNLPATYGDGLMRAILNKQRYPDSLALAILTRFKLPRHDKKRDENKKDKHFTNDYICCAFLKAWLTRKSSTYNLQPMLDENNTQTGYLLGRLFAVLCKTQEDAKEKLNRTVREAFYSGASTTPRSVFPRIIRNYNYHLFKLNTGLRLKRDILAQELVARVSTFPTHLNLEQQGLFALGFYQQTQAFYTSSKQEN